MLEKDKKIRFICGYKFDLNSHTGGEIVDDKYALYEVLSKNNIPVAKHKIVYSRWFLVYTDYPIYSSFGLLLIQNIYQNFLLYPFLSPDISLLYIYYFLQ